MKAVIWTDVFQAGIMLVGLVATAVIGIINVGSFEKVVDVARKYKRLDIEYVSFAESFTFTFVAICNKKKI